MEHTEKKETREEALRDVLKNRSLALQTHFWRYAWCLVTQNSIYVYARRVIDWFRRFRLVAFLIRIFTLFFTLLQTGAAILLSTLLFLVALPLLLSLLLGILLTAFLESGRSNRLLLEATRDKQVYVLFPTKEPNVFFIANARSLATRENACVIVVSPYWISSRGLSKGYFYCTSRKEEKNIYLIRRYYFFSLRKNVLEKRETAFLF